MPYSLALPILTIHGISENREDHENCEDHENHENNNCPIRRNGAELHIPRSKKLNRYKSMISGIMHQSILLIKRFWIVLSVKSVVDGASTEEGSLLTVIFSLTPLMVPREDGNVRI